MGCAAAAPPGILSGDGSRIDGGRLRVRRDPRPCRQVATEDLEVGVSLVERLTSTASTPCGQNPRIEFHAAYSTGVVAPNTDRESGGLAAVRNVSPPIQLADALRRPVTVSDELYRRNNTMPAAHCVGAENFDAIIALRLPPHPATNRAAVSAGLSDSTGRRTGWVEVQEATSLRGTPRSDLDRHDAITSWA